MSLSAFSEAVESLLGELAPLFTALNELAVDFTASEQEAVVRYLGAAAARMRQFLAEGREA